MAEINTRIILRNDTAANWEDSEVKLKAGEAAVEIIDGKAKLKIATADDQGFAAAPYVGGAEANVFQVELTADETDIEAAIDKVVGTTELAVGDIAIVKAGIAGDKHSYTSYVWDGANWAATDGNYSAANVYTNSKITLAGDYGQDSRKDKITSIGNLRIGDEIAAGTSLQSLLMDMLSQRLQPAITANPSISITLNEAGAKEVGTEVTPTYKTGTNDGAYTYEATTGVTFSGWNIETVNRNTVHEGAELQKETATATTGSFTKFVVDEDTNYKVTATANGTAGTIAVDNLGDPSNPTIQIAAKDGYTATSSAVTGYRAWFYGYKKGSDAKFDVANLTSANIRSLTASNGSIPAKINATEMQQMFFAIPKGTKTKIAVEGTNPVAPQTVSGPITVSVEGANGFTAIDYDVWYISNATAAAGRQDYNITVS